MSEEKIERVVIIDNRALRRARLTALAVAALTVSAGPLPCLQPFQRRALEDYEHRERARKARLAKQLEGAAERCRMDQKPEVPSKRACRRRRHK